VIAEPSASDVDDEYEVPYFIETLGKVDNDGHGDFASVRVCEGGSAENAALRFEEVDLITFESEEEETEKVLPTEPVSGSAVDVVDVPSSPHSPNASEGQDDSEILRPCKPINMC
jgi:hypothetical protein